MAENDSTGYRVLQSDDTAFRLDTEVGCWLDQGMIHTKAVTSYGDPVELTATEARLFAEALLRFVAAIEAEDAIGETDSARSP
jgi:glycogen debranching enzyme